MQKLITRWQKDIEKILNMEEDYSLYNLSFHFIQHNTKKEVLAVILHFYLNYTLDFRDITKEELEKLYGYYLEEAKDELTLDESTRIKQRMEYLFKEFYSGKDGKPKLTEQVKLLDKPNDEELPFEID